MSNQYYNLKWQEAINDLQDQFQLENLPLEQEKEGTQPKGQKKQDSEWFLFYATLYIKYVDVYKKLEDCYDQMLHPQKRQLLREMLDNVMVQMCSTKSRLVRVNTLCDYTLRSDFVNLDELIMDLKLMPDCIEVPIPRFCKEDEKQKLEERNQIVDQLLIDYQDTNLPEVEVYEDGPEQIQEDNEREQRAIEIIAKNERGRIGIERVFEAKVKKKILIQKELQKKRLYDNEGQQNEENAAQVLVKYWRGTIDRLKVQQMKEEEMNFLGIQIPDNNNDLDEEDDLELIYRKKQLEAQPKNLSERVQQQRKKMKMIQEEHQVEYETDLHNLKELVNDNEGADIKEKMLEERRKWIFEQIERNEFQDVPQNIEEFNNRNDVLDEKGQEANLKKQEEDSKKKGKKDDKKGKKGGKPSEIDEFNAEYKPQGISDEVLFLQKIIEKFNKDWATKDENNNFEQKHETQLAMEKVKPTVEQQIQQTVDEIIEIELDNIRTAFGKKKKKQKKKKGPRGGKGGKKKFPGDAFNKGKDPKDMLAFLIEKGVVKKFPEASLSDLKGEPNVLGFKQEQDINRREALKKEREKKEGKEATMNDPPESMPDPSMIQLRSCIAEQIGIPLGSQFARDKLDRNFYYLFYGPKGAGKTLAVRALATECNALLIDISPQNLGDKNDLKSFQAIINSAFRVAQAFQPSIIYCEDIEMIFQGKKKKVKKGDQGSSKPPVNPLFAKMKKPLSEFQKKKFLLPDVEKIEGDKKVKIQVPDRCVFIACSSRPFEGNVKDMRNFFEKKFYFPYPNYATRKLLFRNFVEEKGVKIPENFSLSTIAHITEGFSAGSFKIAIDKVLTKRRIMRIQEEPLTINEFIAPISYTHTTYEDDFKQFRAFTDDVCLFKERRDKKNFNEDDKDKKGGKKGKK